METFIAEMYEDCLLLFFFFFKVESKEQKLQRMKVSFNDREDGGKSSERADQRVACECHLNNTNSAPTDARCLGLVS